MPNKFYPVVLEDGQKKLLPLVGRFFADFYLAGGTAIALQLGHRRSIDFDLFTPRAISQPKIRKIIIKNNHIDRVIIDEKDEYTLIVDGIKLTFLHYPFNIKPSKKFDGYIQLPDLSTLAAMKAYALGRRAKWKDYVDLYWIMENNWALLKSSKKPRRFLALNSMKKIFVGR